MDDDDRAGGPRSGIDGQAGPPGEPLPGGRRTAVTAPADREDLVLSIRDVAKMLGVSRAVELMIERSLEAFDPAVVCT